MLTETGTKLLDFGLANKSEPVRSGEELTLGSIDEGRILGTLPYMSPERLHGQAIDAHGDIFAFGAVLYEMLTGEKAFKKNSSAETIASINQEEPKSIHTLVRNVPKELERIAWRCLRKNPRERYLSMADVQQELQHLHQIFGASGSGINIRLLLRKSRRLKVAVPALLVITILISLAALWIHHNSRMMWARNQAVPEIARLIEEEKPGEAYTLAVEAERYIPHDPALMKSWPDISWLGAIDTTPAGVTVYRRNYGDPGAAWEFVGRTPIEKHRFPLVDSLWRFELQGFDTVQRATFPAGPLKVTMDRTGQAPPGMVRIDLVPPNAATTPVGLFGLAGYDRSLPAALSNYWIDRFEVTNRDFKRFVDAGGYKNSRYWKYKFRKDGRTLPWQDAVKLFRDSTGRPGPATWSSGQYPQGQDDYPVAGVSWFEAAAYAEFAGKMLPTIYHWKAAASPVSGQSILPLSNFGGKGPAPVGTYQGISWSGTYDMAGNAKEWVFNEDITGKRYILGGAWNEPTYLFFQADARSPFDRSPNFGFRCAKYTLNGDESKAANPVFAQVEDYNTEKPASDQLFKAYKGLFSYDKAPLNSVVEPLGETQDWREEKITLDAAYGNERIIAFLFLPKKASPPYQTVIHFTGATAFYERSSANLNQDYLRDLDFIVKSGRAVMFVMFKGMFERWDNFFSFPKSSSFYRDHVVDWSKDLGRSIDYLETRPDIDSSRLAYEGVSMGAALGALLPALESRLKVLVLISPGFYLQKRLPEANQLNFAPHVKIPVLMLNGQYDYIFPVGLSQEPLYREIGTPASQKRRVVYDCGHDIPLSGEIKESLNWLDQYLGPVRPH
jgi:formylglycine-generating enzyme required for sulfatase activity/dienelactone hydrolase